jgi:predicted DNA-binding protein YlxM (UPF0122 family)
MNYTTNDQYDKTKEIVRVYLTEGQSLTLKQIGERFNMTKQAIHQHLRKYEKLENEKLPVYRTNKHSLLVSEFIINKDKTYTHTGRNFRNVVSLCEYLNLERDSRFVKESVKKRRLNITRGETEYLYIIDSINPPDSK